MTGTARTPQTTEEIRDLCITLERLDADSTAEVVRWLASCRGCERHCPVHPADRRHLAPENRRQ